MLLWSSRSQKTASWNKRPERLTSNKKTPRTTRMKILKLQSKIWTKPPRLHSRAALNRLEITVTKFPPILDVVWQQTLETSPDKHKLDNFDKDSSIKTNQTTQGLREKQQTNVASQTLPPKGIQPKKPVIATEFNKHKSETCPRWRCRDNSAKDIENNHSLCWPSFRMD